MSSAAQIFGEGYRGKPLKVEQRAGVEHLVTGQHEAIWSGEDAEDNQIIELSYVPVSGHQFVVVWLEVEDLKPVAMSVIGPMDDPTPREVPDEWKLSDAMMQAVLRLKTSIEV